MAFVDDYNPINFVDLPSETTPIDAYNLNKMDRQIKKVTAYASAIDTELTDIDDRLSNFDGIVNCEMELGNFDSDANGIYYSYHNKRVRTKKDKLYYLPIGTKISLASYTDARFALAYKKTDGTYSNYGWRTTDFTVVNEGYYAILISNINETAQTNYHDLGDLLTVQKPISTLTKINELEIATDFLKSFSKHNRVYFGWEIGSLTDDGYSSGDDKSYRSQYLIFNNGDKISCPTTMKFKIIKFRVPKDGYGTVLVDNTSEYKFSERMIVKIIYRSKNKIVFTDLSYTNTLKTEEYSYNNKSYFELVETVGTNYASHRGVGIGNTANSFKTAIVNGFKYIETDVTHTSDDVLICFHGSDLSEDTNGTGKPYESTYEYISSLIYSNNEKICLFEDYLKYCRANNVIPLIEIKGLLNYTKIDLIIAMIKKYNFENHCVIICMDAYMLWYVRFLLPNTPLMSISNNMSSSSIESLIEYKIGKDVASISEEQVSVLHEKGLPCGVWTINDANQKESYAMMGVDFITTDSSSPS